MSRGALLLSRHLVQRCSISAYDDGAVDEFNQPIEGYGTPVTGIKCRLTDLTDEEVANARESGTEVALDALLVPLATVVEIGSRVSDVLNRDGSSLDPGPFKVTDVTTRYSDNPEFKRVVMQRVG
jgi:hypothetical protein